MRSPVHLLLHLVVAALLVLAPPPPTGGAEGSRLQWPLRPIPPVVTRLFDAPAPDWKRGHRGVDLAGQPQQPVYATGPGTVVFAGPLADRHVVSLAHPGGLHTSYEPVAASVRPGQSVQSGAPLGRLLAGHPGCPAAACLHWGAMWGRSALADYVDPVGLVATTPIRLKPVSSPP